VNSETKWGNASLLAQMAIENRVAAHDQYLARGGTEDHVPPLVAMSIECLTATCEESTENIPSVVLRNYIWDWHMIPYLILYRTLLRLLREGEYGTWDPDSNQGVYCPLFADPRIDEWSISFSSCLIVL
jgi:hypothetical protein